MQPNTKKKLTREEFDVLKKTIKNLPVHNTVMHTREMPEFIAIKLTNACNLRCKHCYEWNEEGYIRALPKDKQKEEIEIRLIKKVLSETQKEKSRLYLWGGEPLLYSKFSDLVECIKDDPRETIICTNGLKIEERYADILELATACPVELLIAVEGSEEEHDKIRGKGTYRELMRQLQLMLSSKTKYRIKISIHMVVTDYNVQDLYTNLCLFEKLGIDFVYVCLPWYISDELSKEMTDYYCREFAWLKRDSNTKFSWDAFKFRLSKQSLEEYLRQQEKIGNKVWENVVRYQPDFNDRKTLEDFIEGKSISADGLQCNCLFTRVDITPDGEVCVCKHFKEFAVGNLNENSLRELWHSDTYCKIRTSITRKLLPVCSKCNALYLHNL